MSGEEAETVNSDVSGKEGGERTDLIAGRKSEVRKEGFLFFGVVWGFLCVCVVFGFFFKDHHEYV